MQKYTVVTNNIDGSTTDGITVTPVVTKESKIIEISDISIYIPNKYVISKDTTE